MIPAEVLERRMQVAGAEIEKKHLPEETGYVLIYFRLDDPGGFVSWMSNVDVNSLPPLFKKLSESP